MFLRPHNIKKKNPKHYLRFIKIIVKEKREKIEMSNKILLKLLLINSLLKIFILLNINYF